MDAAKTKALFRSKLNAQKKDKRIDSPLVRYNELDQPVCRVCNVMLKSESLWDAHQASRKHHDAINNIKANAAGHTHVDNRKPEPRTESRPKHAQGTELHDTKSEPSKKLVKPQSSSVLPPDFFDDHATKRQKTGVDTIKTLGPDSYKKSEVSAQTKVVESSIENEMDELPSDDVQIEKTDRPREFVRTTTEITGSETKQVKGALPEGFFDNKEADLRARGIKPVKPDVKDEYKEFEKLIQEDLQEVDDRLEEEEIDAAEMIQEFESLEQRAYRDKVEILRKKKLELMAARSAKHGRDSDAAGKEYGHEESSSDDDSDENFAVDWRAQHL